MNIPLKEDERIVCAGFLLLSRKPYWEVRRLLALTEENNLVSTGRIQEIADALQDIDNLLLAMDEKRFADANELLARVEYTFPGIREVSQARMWFAARAQEKVAECEGRRLVGWQAVLLAKQFKRNGDLLAYYGDYLWAQGKKKKARELYGRAKTKTDNRMVLLHIKDRLTGDIDD